MIPEAYRVHQQHCNAADAYFTPQHCGVDCKWIATGTWECQGCGGEVKDYSILHPNYKAKKFLWGIQPLSEVGLRELLV